MFWMYVSKYKMLTKRKNNMKEVVGTCPFSIIRILTSTPNP